MMKNEKRRVGPCSKRTKLQLRGTDTGAKPPNGNETQSASAWQYLTTTKPIKLIRCAKTEAKASNENEPRLETVWQYSATKKPTLKLIRGTGARVPCKNELRSGYVWPCSKTTKPTLKLIRGVETEGKASNGNESRPGSVWHYSTKAKPTLELRCAETGAIKVPNGDKPRSGCDTILLHPSEFTSPALEESKITNQTLPDCSLTTIAEPDLEIDMHCLTKVNECTALPKPCVEGSVMPYTEKDNVSPQEGMFPETENPCIEILVPDDSFKGIGAKNDDARMDDTLIQCTDVSKNPCKDFAIDEFIQRGDWRRSVDSAMADPCRCRCEDITDLIAKLQTVTESLNQNAQENPCSLHENVELDTDNATPENLDDDRKAVQREIDLKEENVRLKELLRVFEIESKKMKSELQTTAAGLADVTEKNSTLQDAMSWLEVLINLKNNKLEKKVEWLEKLNKSKNKKLAEERQVVKELGKENQSLKDLNKYLETDVGKIKSQLESINVCLDERNRDFDRVKLENIDLINGREELEREIDSLQKKFECESFKLKTLEKEKLEFQERDKCFTAELKKIKCELVTKSDNLCELINEKEELMRIIGGKDKEKEEALEILKNRYKKMEEDYAALQIDLRTVEVILQDSIKIISKRGENSVRRNIINKSGNDFSVC